MKVGIRILMFITVAVSSYTTPEPWQVLNNYLDIYLVSNAITFHHPYIWMAWWLFWGREVQANSDGNELTVENPYKNENSSNKNNCLTPTCFL